MHLSFCPHATSLLNVSPSVAHIDCPFPLWGGMHASQFEDLMMIHIEQISSVTVQHILLFVLLMGCGCLLFNNSVQTQFTEAQVNDEYTRVWYDVEGKVQRGGTFRPIKTLSHLCSTYLFSVEFRSEVKAFVIALLSWLYLVNI